MSDYVATAGIRLRADPTGFREQLRTTLISSTKGISAKIPVTPDMRGFRASLLAGVATAKQGITVQIPIEAGQVRRAASTAAREGNASASKAATAAIVREAAAVDHLTQAENLLSAATRRGITEKQQDILLDKAATSASAALAAETQKLAAVQNNANRASEARARRAVEGVEAARERIRVQRDEAAEAIRASEIRADAQRKLLTAQGAIDVANQKAVKLEDSVSKKIATSNEVRTLQANLIQQEKQLKVQLAAAEQLDDAVLQNTIRDKQREIVLRKENAATAAIETKEIARGTRAQAARNAQAAKGVAATAAGATGIRGATLAASAPFLAGAVAVTSFIKALQGAAGLESTLSVFAETAGASADQMERAGEEAVRLGRDITLPGVSASDAATAFTELAKAGLSVEDSVDGARGVLQLATAAAISNAEATELAASALNTFGLAGSQAERVADLLTGASNEAQGSISDMGIALRQSGAAAQQVGVSLEDTVALLTLLARNGLNGSDAGTSLRTAFLRLINPTERAKKVLGQLNVNLRDINTGAIRPEAFAELGVALEGVSRKQRDAAFATIGGADAFRSLSILAREGVDGLNEVREATQQQGLAADLAGARTKGFTGQVEALKNSLSTLGTSFGQFLIGPAGSVVDTATELTTAVQDLADALEDLQESTPGGGFLGDFFGEIPVTGGDFVREFRNAIDLAKRGEFGTTFDSATESARKFNQEIIDSVDTTRELAAVLRDAQGLTFTPVPNTSIAALETLKNNLIGNSEEVRELRERLTDVQRLIQALGRAPTQIELDVFLEKGFVDEATIAEAERQLAARMKVVSQNASGVLIDEMTKGLDPALFEALGFGIPTAIQKGIDSAPPLDLGLSLAQIEAQIGGFEARGRRAEIAGDTAARLEELGQERAFLERQIAKAAAEGRTPLRVKLEETLLGVINEIDQINSSIQSAREQQKADAERRQREIEQARKDAHDAQIKIFERAVARAENRILIASATKSLQDDLAAARNLKKVIQGIIASGKLTTDELLDFRNQLIQSNQDIKKVQEDIAQARKDRRDALIESAELDVELAVTRENVGAEIRARQRVIALLRKRLADEKKGTVEWKRIRNEIAEQQKAIKDAKKAVEDRNNAFQELTFEFLQAQQGFAANLFGNLIPLASTANLVGNTSVIPPSSVTTSAPTGGSGGPPPVRARREGQVAQATGAGATSLQTSSLIEVNKQILRVLQLIARGQGLKEAQSQQHRQAASMDYGI